MFKQGSFFSTRNIGINEGHVTVLSHFKCVLKLIFLQGFTSADAKTFLHPNFKGNLVIENVKNYKLCLESISSLMRQAGEIWNCSARGTFGHILIIK